MAKAEEEKKTTTTTTSWLMQRGQYLGEISALSFLQLPPHLSSFPFLLAGTGSHILLYDVEAGKLLNSFNVFQGIRVHGISIDDSICDDGSSSKLSFKIVVFGEKRVKLFNLNLQMDLGCQNQLQVCSELVLIHSLPKFSHWVLDVCFLKEDKVTSDCNSSTHLAIGLSDNSVCLWDVSRSTIAIEVRCPERTLLYSMRLWGDNMESLRVASGTIYNEVIVWKFLCQRNTVSSSCSTEDSNNLSGSFCNNTQLNNQCYEAICLSILAGHEGSIFRLVWSSDGSKLMSVSDDRSARIWTINAERENLVDSRADSDPDLGGLILFGHNARVWDCCISESLIFTVGEDCTCRMWGLDGKQLMMIKEHIGRGIWRCAYDPNSSLLITAGFDSSIKVHLLDASMSRGSMELNGKVKDFMGSTDIFTISPPSLSDQYGLMDSKSEYVRCLHFAREDTLYVATNRGYLHHVELSDPGNVKWTKLARINVEGPIVCMDLVPAKSTLSRNIEDWIAVGDGKGNVTVIKVISGVLPPKMGLSFTWSAGIERQLLGTYWCKSLGCSYIFTADPRGILKLWRINDSLLSGFDVNRVNHDASLIAEFTSCFGTRILCLDALLDEELLVCGDQRGNLTVFPLSKDLLVATSIASEMKIHALNYFKGAHGISSVASILITKSSFSQVEIRSTGGDGCICYFKYDKDWRNLEFTGMKQVKELSLVQSVSADVTSDADLVRDTYATGFTSADFIIWNLVNEIKVAQIPCGGWRRPHSYHLGDVPECQNCFAFVKDQTIYIHRNWLSTSERKLLPSVLHTQYHGREIHSLCFISDGSQVNTNRDNISFIQSSCIATGCEDGTVRLTRYTPDSENCFTSTLLGEHVGGSAVRSICFVAKIYISTTDKTFMSEMTERCDAAPDDRDNLFLLISVGAKRVVTSWLLRNRRLTSKEVKLVDEPLVESNKSSPLSRAFSSMSFQWLSTDMPSKFSSTYNREESTQKNVKQGENDSHTGSVVPFNTPAESSELELRSGPGDKNENDWRYLAVTAFLVKGVDPRLSVCFMVVSCSDATLTLRALLLPYRLWFDVASLTPQTSPVLALQHVVIPIPISSRHNFHYGNAYIAISGSTNGSITFWDLTESVEGFIQRLSKLQPEKFIDCQKRPRTGRGSQGGRWWRSLDTRSSKTNPKYTKETPNAREAINGHVSNHVTSGASSELTNDPLNSEPTCIQPTDGTGFLVSKVQIDNSPPEDVAPFHVLNNVHQSGVNCLHISNISDCQNPEVTPIYCVLSGGDDQSLHFLTFTLPLPQIYANSENTKPSDITNNVMDTRKFSLCCEKKGCIIKFLFHDRVPSAHSSAVKGVWTDGTWAFSTGLDQRVRCWHIKEHRKLTEHSHLVISVPEPESLDAIHCGRYQYQIAVAGRGMQMVMFRGSSEREGNE